MNNIPTFAGCIAIRKAGNLFVGLVLVEMGRFIRWLRRVLDLCAQNVPHFLPSPQAKRTGGTLAEAGPLAFRELVGLFYTRQQQSRAPRPNYELRKH